MEEWIGRQWHRLVTRRAQAGLTGREARLEDVRRAVTLLLHAGGGRQRIATATPIAAGRPAGRTLWQRLAGTGRRVPLAQLDGEVLALPERVAVFADPALNRALYLWWAVLASSVDPALPWARANLEGRHAALGRFPGFRATWRRLVAAELALRPAEEAGRGATAERRLHTLLVEDVDARGPSVAPPTLELGLGDVAPVWTWLVPAAAGDGEAAGHDSRIDGRTPAADLPPREGSADALAGRRRARRQDGARPRAPLLLAAKGESLKVFADPLAVNRDHDDADDGDAAVAAEELDTITLQRSTGSLAARVRFDLDLPSAAADDLPVGDGEALPEWDPRHGCLQPDRVLAQAYVARNTDPWQPGPMLRTTAARVRRRMELQHAAPCWRPGVADGDEIDVDAWVRGRGATPGSAAAEAVYRRRVRGRRELATLLLADLSLSTDAYANDRQRIIDVVRDALFVFGESLAGSGDACAILGFSSVRRHLRLHEIKDFAEPWSPRTLARIGALRPGYYTRMGAALRAGTRRLALRPERQRLLLLLTDGKPHDLDGYDGRFGIEDTRQAVLEARRCGVLPFALSIDSEAGAALPALFGQRGWAWVRRPEELPQRLAGLYAQLTR